MVCSSLVFVASAAGPTPVSVSPASQTLNAGASFTIAVNCVPGQPVKAFELKVSFNPSLLLATAVAEGSFFGVYKNTSKTFFNAGTINNAAGTIVNIYDLIVGPGNVSAAGSLVTITFTAKSISGTSALTLYDVRLTNESEYLTVSVSSGSVTVEGSAPPPPDNPPGGGGGSNPPADENARPNKPVIPSGPMLIERGVSYGYSSNTFDPDGDQVRLRFDWGDGSLSNWTALVAANISVSASHTWENMTNISVRAIAQDEHGLNSSWSDALTVLVSSVNPDEVPPVVDFNSPSNASANQTVSFEASVSTGPDIVVVSYLWDFGDGQTSAEASPTHMYLAPGQYTVTLTVTDSAGLTSSKTTTVIVSQAAVAPSGAQTGSTPFNSTVIVLSVVAVALVLLLVVFRNRIRLLFLQKSIDASKGRIASFDSKVAEIDKLVDSLFVELKNTIPNPNRDTMLNEYCDMILDKVENKVDLHVPGLSIKEVERLVDERIHARVAGKLDKK